MRRWSRYRWFVVFLSVGLMLAMFASPAPAAGASLRLSPTLGPHGTRIEVSGKGFRPNELVDVYLDREDLTLGVAEGDGTFGVRIVVPGRVRLGTHLVTAVGRASGRAARTTFDVIPSTWTSWPQIGGDAGRRGHAVGATSLDAEAASRLQRVWTAGETYPNAVLVSGRTLVVAAYGSEASAGSIVAFDAWTGGRLWSVEFAYPTAIAAWRDLVLAASNGTLTAYDVGSGSVRWTARVGPYRSAPWSGFVVEGDVAYLAQNSDAGHRPSVLSAFDLATTRTSWTTSLGDTAGWIGPSVVTEGTAVVSVGQGLVAIGVEHGDVRWSKPWIMGWSGSLVADAGTVFACASSREELRAIDATSGRVAWRSPLTPGEWVSGAATDGVRLYVPYGPWEDQGPTGLRAYEVATGHVLWDRSSTSRPGVPTVANGLVYTATEHAVMVLAAASGRTVHTVSLAADLWDQPIVANATVYLPAVEGVLALRPPGAAVAAIATLTPDATLVPGAGHEVGAQTAGWTGSSGLDPSLGASVASTAELDGVLYLGTEAAPRGSAAILRTSDGSTLEPAVRFPNVSSVRLGVFRGRLYAATRGSRGASLYVSSDGRTFALLPGIDTGSIDRITPIVWRDSLLLLADTASGPLAYASADGVTFAPVRAPSGEATKRAAFAVDPTGRGAIPYGGALYLGVRAPGGGEIWRTSDGATLERVATGGLGRLANRALVPQLVFGGHLFVMAEGPLGIEIFRTSDGVAYERTAAAGFHAGLDRNLTGELATIARRLVLVTGSRNPVGGTPPMEIIRTFGLRIYTSVDGLVWRRVATASFADPYDWTGSVLAADGSLYLAASNYRQGDGVWRSADAITWTTQLRLPASGVNTQGPVLVLYDRHLLVLHGDSASGITVWRSAAAVQPAASRTWQDWELVVTVLAVLLALGWLSAQAWVATRNRLPPHAHVG